MRFSKEHFLYFLAALTGFLSVCILVLDIVLYTWYPPHTVIVVQSPRQETVSPSLPPTTVPEPTIPAKICPSGDRWIAAGTRIAFKLDDYPNKPVIVFRLDGGTKFVVEGQDEFDLAEEGNYKWPFTMESANRFDAYMIGINICGGEMYLIVPPTMIPVAAPPPPGEQNS